MLKIKQKRPHDYNLEVIFGGPYRARTGHLFHAMEALYQMS
jgi:hypothetical protein